MKRVDPDYDAELGACITLGAAMQTTFMLGLGRGMSITAAFFFCDIHNEDEFMMEMGLSFDPMIAPMRLGE